MRVIALSAAAACLFTGIAVAQQTTNTPNSTAAPANTTTGQSHNPAVASTSNANDSTAPAKGSNSFTEGQAKDRIAQRGYTDVAGLKKDDAGVWRGTAQHAGNQVQVWLDYKGNVGEVR
jgi:hypothetical protein